MKPDNFVHLHVHDHYSFQDGYGTPAMYIQRAVELGQPGLATTNHGNVSSHFKHYKGCNKAGIQPILGCEMYIVKDKNDIRERDYNHMIVLVKNNKGYKNLMKLVTRAWTEQFYYKPRITYQDLFDHQEGLIVLSGCLSSPFMDKIKKGREKEATEEFLMFHEKLDDFYFEMQPIMFEEGLPVYQKAIEIYEKTLKKKGVKMVATNDCHYVKKEQAKVQEVLLCIQSNDEMSNPSHWHFDQEDFHLKSRKEMEESLNECHPDYDFTEALDNTVKISESIDFKFPTAKPISFPMEESMKSDFLFHKCMEGLARMGKNEDPVYIERLAYELDLINKKGFIDYFLVIHDLINWSKDNGILVGPGRGSAAGSLACCALRITEVDPIVYGLIFERFIDINRADLPDIDIDFEDARRHEVKTYLQMKYGYDKVGTLPTFAEFKGKSALMDIGRVFKIPFVVIDEIKGLVLERSGGDSRAGFTLADTFTNETFTKPAEALKLYPELKYAIDLEGQYRQMGQHAAGVVISNEPITNFCALYKVKDEFVLSMDYKDVTDIGLLKIDVLGLSTLSVVSKTMRYIKERHNKIIDPYTLPLDDKKTYKGFREEKLFGVFQFDGQAVNQVSRQIKPKDFEDLSAVSALARPGPLNSGNTTEYIMRRSGKQKVTYVHKIMEGITGGTYGVVIYQEQVMRIMREIGDMSWEDTSAIRKNMSRSLGVEAFNSFRAKFMPGALGHGLSEEVASKIWDEMCSYGSWAFNKCITGDTLIENCNPNQFVGKQITIENLFKNKGYASPKWKLQPNAYKKMNTLGMDLDGQIRPSRIKDVFFKGVHQVFEITTESGKKIKATSNHRFLSNNRFKKLHKFSEGDFIAVNGGYQETKYISKGALGKGWRKGRVGGAGDSTDGSTYEVKRFKELNIGKNCEHCDALFDRMEVHHVTRNAPNSILEWLCVSCHKMAEYKIGRTKVWQKGFPILFEKIVSIKKLKKEKVYDIEMEDKSRPSFIANGIVSHNSHSISYGFISYWTMWLKVHYPIEFYASILAITEMEDKRKKIIKEYKREGFKVLPVDINRSKQEFTIDDEGLRIGFKDVKGIGDGAADKLVRHQPYKNYQDTIHLPKGHTVSEKVRQLLIDLGAFDSIEKASCVEDLFGTSSPPYSKGIISFEDRFNLCPWDIDFEITKKWLPYILANHPHPFKDLPTAIEKLNDMKTGFNEPDVVLYGIVYDKNMRDAREVSATKGKSIDMKKYNIIHIMKPKAGVSPYMTFDQFTKYKPRSGRNDWQLNVDYEIIQQYRFANFVIEDDSDFLTCRLSHLKYPEYANLIFEQSKTGDVIMLRGKMGSGIRMFFVNKVMNLRIYQEEQEKKNGNKQLSEGTKISV